MLFGGGAEAHSHPKSQSPLASLQSMGAGRDLGQDNLNEGEENIESEVRDMAVGGSTKSKVAHDQKQGKE